MFNKLVMKCVLLLSVALGMALTAQGAERIALVIGNAAYAEAPLRNPVNDAKAMSTVLQDLGFDVISLENADRDTMAASIQQFAEKLKKDATGLFYYAGHGVQARGRNFLIPVDAKLETVRALRFEAINVDTILEEMELSNNRVNFVILDACRNNPFERKLRGSARGLAPVDAAKGTLIAYATAPGSVAADGSGENGLYTAELLKALRAPNLKAEEVFKRVRVAVTERTQSRQVPWESSSLTGDFVFNGSVTVEKATIQMAPVRPDREVVFWQSIKDSNDPAMYQAYVEKYPGGEFAILAKLKL